MTVLLAAGPPACGLAHFSVGYGSTRAPPFRAGPVGGNGSPRSSVAVALSRPRQHTAERDSGYCANRPAPELHRGDHDGLPHVQVLGFASVQVPNSLGHLEGTGTAIAAGRKGPCKIPTDIPDHRWNR